MKSKNWVWIVLAIVVVALIVGILINSSQNKGDIKIGAIIFLTGNQASLGEEVKNAFVLANDINNAKGGKQIELIIEDSQDNPTTAISAYNKLKLENVALVISTGDQVSYALNPIANQDKMVIFNTVAASGQISGAYAFRGWVTAEKQAKVMGDYAINDLKLKRFGVIAINNIYGESYLNQFKETIGGSGEVVSEELYGIMDSDVKTQITKAMASNPDAIVVAGFGPAYPLVFKQLRELGWEGIILTDNSLSIPYFFNSIGIENLNNTYFSSTNFDATNPVNPQMKDFVERYKAKYGAEPGFVGAFAFDSYNILYDTLQKCNKGSDSIKNCLLNVKDEQGVLGTIDLSTHDMVVPLYIKQVENNSVIIAKEITD